MVIDNWERLSGRTAQERVEIIAAETGRRAPRWADQFVAEAHAGGLAEGHAEGHAGGLEESLDTAREKILREVSSGPDPETAGKLAERLEPISDLDLLMEVHGQIRGGMSGPELLAWMDAQA